MALPLVTRLDRYILRQLLAALAAATGALVALIWLTQSLRFVELVVNRGLSLLVFLQLTSLLIPNFVAVILPITTFVVIQFVYQRLAGDRELTVMRAAGLSPFALSRPALGLTALAMALCLVLNIWVVPKSFAAFRQYQFEIRNRMAAFLLQEGVFTPISDQLTVYVRSRDPDGTLRGIMVEDDRQKDTRATILAEHGRLIETAGPPRVLLVNGSREEIDKKTGRLDVLTFAQNAIDLADSTKDDGIHFRDVTEMSLAELLHPDPRQLSNPHDYGKFVVEAHRRMTAPLTVFSFAMVAMVSGLSGTFRRHGGVLRPMVAIGVVVGLLALGLAISNLAARDPDLVGLIWVQAILPGLASAAALYGPMLISGTGALRPGRVPVPQQVGR
ncbi:MAG TPA: LPS export ABC transporter permease LptF [Acetobacteraceae bacterium]|nr:LPS export ABC transporter permease LptF [Acetobacteraceae bacterium]